jgi:rhodanese-related sulfurtransferase
VRIERRVGTHAKKMMVPARSRVDGFVVVDSTWGTIQPLEVAPGVQTVAELDVIGHLRAGRTLVDTRRGEQRAQATIPGAVGIPHEEIVERVAELDRDGVTVLFCNGPQCAATPMAVQLLLAHGYEPGGLRYYRGGLHDWMTLGLPIEGSRAAESDPADHGVG